jgi:Domain of unknown function (DUF4384)
MRLTIVLFGLICVSALVINAVPLALQEQEDVRGAFLTTRPKEKSTNSSTAPRTTRRKPKPTVTEPDTKGPSGGSTSVDKNGPAPVNSERLGLGLTLFMRDTNGLAVRTDPSRVFHQGDRVRVLLETNTDGYLYIFNTTNDGSPTMIYPEADLDEGGNYLQSHVPFEIPSSLAAEERFRWLVFDENAGDERLFFVFTREPLQGLPIDDDLIALCRDSSSSCPVRPSKEVWARVEKEMNQPLQTDRSNRYGRAQTASEQQASTRGLGLAKDDPQPSLIMMASSTTSTLVTTLDLIHK